MTDFERELQNYEEIPANAFRGRKDIKYLKIPDGIKRIGAGAFADCANLKEVFIPDSVEIIEENAFTHFELICCEHFIPPKGWFVHEEDGEMPVQQEETDILEEIMFSTIGRTWCGSYAYQLTWDEFMAEGKHYFYYPQRKVIWGRDWRQFLLGAEGEWYFDGFSYLEWLGEDWLRKGMIPNFNPIAKEILDELKEKMRNEFTSDDNITQTIKLYNEVLLDSIMVIGHGIEYLFGQWALYHFVWQVSQMKGIPEKRKNWIRPAAIQKAKYSKELYDTGGERWKRIEALIETGG